MEKDIDINGINIHYEETGDSSGSPVVIMHGWGCDHTTVRSVAIPLESGMRVINVDLPGHGKSDEPSEVWGVEEFTRCMEEFLSRLKLESPALIGHSFGGRISILLSSRNPIKKVVLVDAAGVRPRHGIGWYVKVYRFKMLKRMLLMLYGKEKGEKKIAEMRDRKGSADYRNASPMMKRILSKCVNEDLKSVMPSITASTLLVWGENDTATPLSDAKIMERLIPDAGLVSFPDCGHYSFLDNPGGFRAVIMEFFKNELKKRN
ncbi:MAG: alpha/beta hydrolase [Muribaculaceae bacterium]|nr:alpha/beta hydrolase [Muribaculaceae bacterium]